MLIQELRSQLDERNGGSAFRASGRPQASNKKSFTPVDVSKVESPLFSASASMEDEQAMMSAGNNDLSETLEQKLEESSPQSDEKTGSNLSKLEMFKAKMKSKAMQKSSEGL